MKKKLSKKLNIKSEKGFTVQDLVAAIIIFGIFTSLITTLMSSAYQLSNRVKVTENAVHYAVAILEDIDKMPYEEVGSSLTEEFYQKKFQIPEGFEISIDVKDASTGTMREDIMKKVKLTISYTLYHNPEQITVERYKIREL